MDVSVILATYNQPEWLEKVCWGYHAQQHRNFELVIADDGSDNDTRELIERMRRELQLDIQHVWHEDDGFRKCAILNKALLAAKYDYVVFSDGDCIPRADFLATHVKYALPGHFLSGGLVRLPLDVSQDISRDDIARQRALRPRWLRGKGMAWNKKLLMLTRSSRWAKMLDRLTTTKPTWNGHNSSGWKADLLRVNGFDERMGYGGEDRELGQRLVNCGITPLQIRHQAVCVHLEHGRGYVDPEVVEWNKQHRRQTDQQNITWTDHGAVGIAEDTQELVLLHFPNPQAEGRDQATTSRAA